MTEVRKLWRLGWRTKIAMLMVGASAIIILVLFCTLFAYFLGYMAFETNTKLTNLLLMPGVLLIFTAAVVKVYAEYQGETPRRGESC